MSKPWKVQIHGKAGDKAFEISVINTRKCHSAQLHYGWFDENKLLITHNGGPCRWPMVDRVWGRQVALAHQIAEELNQP